ncbi:MAG: right-handed parallel beta-helix repeat-containing protein [Chthoniobacterales bacterium]|nr:right-handed parallel beta-helix repeat-containing protein [Chthoniobacterales bacterium]
MKFTTRFGTALALAALLFILAASNAAAATFTVTNTNDSGAGSLRQAVVDSNAAAGSDTIVFNSLFDTPQTITLASVITINPATGDSLTITGPGADLLTVSGNNAVRIFAVDSGDTATISGMTLTQGTTVGAGAAGSAIDNDGNLTVTSSTFSSNTAGWGGAIANGLSLTVAGCTFTDNTATSGSSTALGGGAIYSNATAATVSISNSTFTGNDEIGGSGGGGAIRNRGGTMNISNSTFTSNTAVDGGGAVDNNDVMTMDSCTISGNTVSGTLEGGGGIENLGQLTLARSVVTGNSAARHGGGIYHHSQGSDDFLEITDSTISNNTANTARNSTGNGGGIYVVTSAELTITRSTVSGNTVLLTLTPTELSHADGGGIWSDGQVVMDNCTVSGNTAELNFGGVRVPHNFSDSTITNSTIVNNIAATGGGIGRDDCNLGCESLSIGNTIIANNMASAEPDIRNRLVNPTHSSPITSLGYNLFEVTAGAYISLTPTDITGVDPNLGPLQGNGGLTFTHALQPGSPAIDKGKSTDVLTDQRGLPRPYDHPGIPNATSGDGSDIGAFEDQPPNTSPGSNVTVESPAGDVTVTFATISQGGFTTFILIDPPSSAGPPPPGYTILEEAPAYDISTTASFTPPITVCFTVSSITDEAEFARLRILHGEDGQLVDRTDLDSLDFASRTVCAQVDSLSPFVVALAPAPGLLNISTRMQVLTGDQVLIGGFIITGTDPKMVILRAIGPSLTDFGVAGALADPVLELRAVDGSVITSNDNWTDDRAAIEATGLQPTDDLESAIVATLDPGAYTAIVSGKNGTTGVGLVEAYDLDTAADSELANISTRGFVATESNVMIGGFILGSESDVVVRAIGPSLTAFGVPDALEDPTLELRDVQGALISSNDNWMDTQQDEIEATGLAPQDELEAALLETLNPGAYTAIVSGQGGGTGVGLVEVYRLP